MKIANITRIGKHKVYDLSVDEVEHYVLENGVVTHNTGIYYSADNIFIIGRQQEKTGTDLVGYNFIINVEKSRFVREKSKIPIEVTFEGGISKWSGLLDMAIEAGHIVKPSNGWYQIASDGTDSKKYRRKETDTKEFWIPILSDKSFNEWIERRYIISSESIMNEEVTSEDVSAAYSDE